MSNHNDGGPAFPFICQDHSKYQTAIPGMTIRDYFAAKAMAAIIAKQPLGRATPENEESLAAWAEACAMATVGAYMYADAMLRAREEKP
jgi:hypothetical protein